MEVIVVELFTIDFDRIDFSFVVDAGDAITIEAEFDRTFPRPLRPARDRALRS
jgi:hypothetical protein